MLFYQIKIYFLLIDLEDSKNFEGGSNVTVGFNYQQLNNEKELNFQLAR